MKSLFFVLLLAVTSALPPPAMAQTAPDAAKFYASAADIQAFVVKARTERKTAGIGTVEPIAKVGPYQMQLEYRTGPTRPALHHRDAGWAYVVQGSCTFLTGGTLRDSKPASPGSTTDVGTAIDGGAARKLAKGDFIMVPPGLPHQFLDIQGEFVIVSMHMPMPEKK